MLGLGGLIVSWGQGDGDGSGSEFGFGWFVGVLFHARPISDTISQARIRD